MATKAELRAKVTLNSSPFQKGLKRLRGFTRRFSRNFGAPMAAATKRMMRLGAVASTVVVAGFIAASKAVANFLDNLDKMSARTGIAVNDLVGFSLAAELGGAKLSDVEKAMKRLSVTVIDGNRGLKTATDIFEELGIEFEQFRRLKPSEQFNLILKKLKDIPDATRRAGLAQKIFGRAGTALLPVIENLEQAQKLAEKFGLKMDPQTIKDARDFQDSITLTKFALKGLFVAAFGFKDLNRGLAVFREKLVALRQSTAFKTFVTKFKNGVTSIVDGTIRLIKMFGILSTEQGKNFRKLIKNAAILVLFLKTGFLMPIIKIMAAVGLAIAAPLLKIALPALAGFLGAVAAMNVGKALDAAFDLSGFMAKIHALGKALIGFFSPQKGEAMAATFTRVMNKLEDDLTRIDDMAEKKDFGKALAEEFDKTFEKIGDGAAGAFEKAKKSLQDLLPTTLGIKELTDAWKKTADEIELGEDAEFAKNQLAGANAEMNAIANAGKRFRGGFVKTTTEISKNVRNLADVKRNRAARQKDLEARGVGQSLEMRGIAKDFKQQAKIRNAALEFKKGVEEMAKNKNDDIQKIIDGIEKREEAKDIKKNTKDTAAGIATLGQIMKANQLIATEI